MFVHAQFRDSRCKGVAAHPCPCDVVAGVLEYAQQVRFGRFDQVCQTAVPRHVRVPAGEERRSARRADRLLDIGVGESGAARGERIEVGVLTWGLPNTPTASARSWSGMNTTKFGREVTGSSFLRED